MSRGKPRREWYPSVEIARWVLPALLLVAVAGPQRLALILLAVF